MSHNADTIQSWVDFLQRALPLADRITLPEGALLQIAEHADRVRRQMSWGPSIPRDLFLAYVLFPRVNNEDPVLYHGPILASLEDRLRGLSLPQAILEVNRWCFEQATYRSTDGRTANALTVMRRGFGRCGEESVLLVSALRACGIPARQVYAPLWSHCDDNHAWVEAWADGGWHYLGACEPELALDSGWFTAAASRAMLTHTRAWGVLPEGERAECFRDGAWILNRTAGYAPTRILTVTVREGGAPLPGIRVIFQLCNMAAFRSICEKSTDDQGRVDLLAGLGTLRVRATDGRRSLEADVDLSRQAELALDFSRAAEFDPGASDFEQRPPRETRMQPAGFPEALVAAHERRLAEAERARLRRFERPGDADPLLLSARGNRDVVEAFLADGRWDAEDRRALLESLREKDLADVTREVLEDAIAGAAAFRQDYPRDVWVEGVLCPRVWEEMLRPVRAGLRARLPEGRDPIALWAWLRGRMRPIEVEPARLIPDLAAMLDDGRCSAQALDVLFVASARALGIAARLDGLTGEKQCWRDGAWQALLPERQLRGTLALENGAGRPLAPGVDYSVAVLEDGAYRPLELAGEPLADRRALALAPGKYRVTAVSRQIDGSLEGRQWQVALAAGEVRCVTLTLPADRTADRLLRRALPPLAVCRGQDALRLPEALGGRRGIVAFIAPGQEPTEHFLNELLESADALQSGNIAVCLVVKDPGQLSGEKLRRVLRELPGALGLHAPDGEALVRWRELLNARELRLPLAVAVGRAGAGLFAFVNYNVGSVSTLIRILDAEQEAQS